MLAKIEQLLQEVENLTASNADELEALRIKYLRSEERRVGKECRL